MAVASNTEPSCIPTSMPAFISADEAYFWSFDWQKDIRESIAAVGAGDAAHFNSDDPSDVVRWLLSPDSPS